LIFKTQVNHLLLIYSYLFILDIQGFKNLIEEKKGNPTQKDLSDFGKFFYVTKIQFSKVKKEYEIALPKLKEISQELTFIKDKLEDQLVNNIT